MKKLLAITLLGACATFALPASATENAQQERMKTCNTKATGMKGDERKKFMSDCLSAEKKASDNKMAACNTKSKGMKGDEHKKFMSECLKATS
jgi:psiF repeat